ncbi:MAG: FliG C-terminal domain-containing protein [Kofleriaceae bacterium]
MTTTPNGARKAAIALLSLDEAVAADILTRLPEAQIRQLCATVEHLGPVTHAQIVDALSELERGLTDPLAMAGSIGTAYVRRLAHRALGDERAHRLLGPQPEATSSLHLLRSARVQTMASLLAEEHPQIAAVVLTQLPSALAAKVLAAMAPTLAADLIERLAGLDELPEHAVADASDAIVRALEAAGGLATSDVRRSFDGLAFSAAVLNELPTEQGDELLGTIATLDELAATRIREAMFTFEDLQQIDPREIGGLLRAISNDTLLIALQGATPELRDHFLRAMSQRVAQTLRDDLAAAPPRRLADIEAGRREIIEVATRLIAEGKLTKPARGADA